MEYRDSHKYCKFFIIVLERANIKHNKFQCFMVKKQYNNTLKKNVVKMLKK